MLRHLLHVLQQQTRESSPVKIDLTDDEIGCIIDAMQAGMRERTMCGEQDVLAYLRSYATCRCYYSPGFQRGVMCYHHDKYTESTRARQ